jgi:transglutaminase-like putative cysteine protease
MIERKHHFAVGAHAALLALAFAIFAWPFALASGVALGALATAAGVLAAEIFTRQRLRLGVIVLIAVGAWAVAAGVGYVITGSAGIAGLLGPTLAIRVGDALRFAGLGFGAALWLRGAAIRFRAALALEGTVVVLAVATTVAAHRDGMIARPLTIADWFWTQGLDPVVAFLGLGLLGALLLAGVLAYGRSAGRTLVQLAVVLLIGVLLASQIYGRDTDTTRDVIGGNAKDDEGQGKEREEAQKRAGGGGGAGGQGDPSQGAAGNKPPPPDLPPPGGSGKQNRPAAIVVFHRGVTPAHGVYYFRHAAFSQWNGTRLIESTAGQIDRDARTAFPTQKQAIGGVPQDSPTRELVANDVALLTDHARVFALTDAVELEPLANPDPARFKRAYRVLSSVVTAPFDALMDHEPGDPSWDDETWAHYTEVPRDERYHELAAELRADLRMEFQDDPLAQAMVVKQWLEKNTTYSFSKNYDGEADPTAAFLFSEEKKGYCVHTSFAAAYLMRAMGLPTRVSAGYAVPAGNLGGGSALLIKSGDAHAWAELYLAGVGWVPIEVTPEKTDVENPPFQENDLQQLLGEMARKEGRDSRDQAEGSLNLRELARALLAALPWVLLAVFVLAYGTKLWRRLAPALSAPRHGPRVAYRAALDALSAVGMTRRRGESRERFAARAAAVAPSFGRLTAVNVGSALGSRAERARGDALGPLASGVAREVRTQVPWWRWLLGLLNPVSWLWSR